jgi:hypothetical protein
VLGCEGDDDTPPGRRGGATETFDEKWGPAIAAVSLILAMSNSVFRFGK